MLLVIHDRNENLTLKIAGGDKHILHNRWKLSSSENTVLFDSLCNFGSYRLVAMYPAFFLENAICCGVATYFKSVWTTS